MKTISFKGSGDHAVTIEDTGQEPEYIESLQWVLEQGYLTFMSNDGFDGCIRFETVARNHHAEMATRISDLVRQEVEGFSDSADHLRPLRDELRKALEIVEAEMTAKADA